MSFGNNGFGNTNFAFSGPNTFSSPYTTFSQNPLNNPNPLPVYTPILPTIQCTPQTPHPHLMQFQNQPPRSKCDVLAGVNRQNDR